MIERVAVHDLGRFRGGYAVRTATVAHRRLGCFPALQAQHLRADGSVAWGELGWVEADPLPANYLVSNGDVLIPLRSTPMRATVARNVPGQVLAVGPLAMLSPDRDRVDPDYLAWYLNHPVTAARLGGLMQGTNLRFLTLAALRDFEVELPPLEIQRRIARAHGLNNRVVELERQLAAARKQLVDSLTMAALRGAVEPETDV